MKTKFISVILVSVAAIGFAFTKIAYQAEKYPWRADQLMEPADLAKAINDPAAVKPLIYSIGPGGNIKGDIEMGPAQEKENLAKFENTLKGLSKDTSIVIYCGCCPFEHCPNVRPAFKLLTDMHFTNFKLLNLSHNIKTDWISKGYPMNN